MARTAKALLNVPEIKKDFPILQRTMRDKPLTYLDSTATSQKPRQVIDAMTDYYSRYNANVHRGVHTLSQRATDRYEAAREKVRAFLNAADTCEIVFVRGATEGINLVASSWGRTNLKDGDVIIVSPAATMKAGDRVVVRTRDGQVMAKELIRRTTRRIELKSVNTRHIDPVIPAKELDWIARIMWVSQ